MGNKVKYLIVEANVLPSVFLKVIQAKKMIAQGKANSSSQAARMVGISRSAFYKYKDCVHIYEDKISERITTLYLTLVDEPGMLSTLLGELYRIGANIITVNQNIPVDGVAPVSISAKIQSPDLDDEQLVSTIKALSGVVSARTI